MRYILGCIKLQMEQGAAALDCKSEEHDAYNDLVDAGNAEVDWGASNVQSWYKNDKGRVTQNWPFTLLEFWQRTKAPDPADYRLL